MKMMDSVMNFLFSFNSETKAGATHLNQSDPHLLEARENRQVSGGSKALLNGGP